MKQIILQWLLAQVEQRPDKTAVIFRGERISYKQVYRKAKEVCLWLQKNGIRRGERVIICAKNSDKFIYCIFGVLMNRACFVPVNPKIDKKQFWYILRNCEPDCILTDRNLSEEGLLEESPKVKAVSIEECYEEDVMDISLQLFDENEEEDLVAIIYTSGTSRFPKGVVERNRQVVFATTAINQVIKNTNADTILCGLPLSFDYGLYQVFLSFQAGACLVLEEDFSKSMGIPKLLLEYEVTGFPGVPSLFNLLLRSRVLEYCEFPKLRYLTSTGDTFSAGTIKKLKSLLPYVTVYPMYGLTECKRVSIMPYGFDETRPEAVGLPLPGVTTKVVNEQNEEVPRGEIGQLVVDGPNIMDGYWNNFFETAIKYRYVEQEDRVLLYTGDLFRMDEEGYLYFEGRRENFIKSRGFKVSPMEVEQVLYSIEGVNQAAVYGLQDSVLGEKVAATLQITKKIDKKYIQKECEGKLQMEKIPNEIRLVRTELPKTINGKVDRKELKRMHLEEIES